MNVEAVCIAHPKERGSYLLYLELAAPPEQSKQRKPVHVALALDASSSMGGQRLACAIEAARAVVDRLGPEDTLCLLAFDRSVRILYGPARVDADGRAQMVAALARLKPGMGTALYGALERSHEVLRRVFVRDARPQAIVLTDGYPSSGPTDVESFRLLARRAAADGIVTSVVGVGVDFDEQCVGTIAEGGGGRYSFVDKAADIPGALSRHLSDLFAVAVENATVRVSPSTAVKEAVLLHRYAMKVGPDGFTVETGPIARGTPRRLLFLLRTSAPPDPLAATVAVSLKNSAEPDRILPIPVSPDKPRGAEAVRELYRLELSKQEEAFWDGMHAGNALHAKLALGAAQEAMAALKAVGVSEAELEGDLRRLGDAQAVLDGRLTAEAREAARKRSHHTAVSRVTSFRLEDD